ncbi:MAG: Rrf2 family transcriptional regulator [Alphaproteobacteria bacterium]|nr:Rrf2 family transcriptional regulator [Alphaproteobacteria bacterium]
MSQLIPSRCLLAVQTVVFIAFHSQQGEPVKSSRIIERYHLNKRALEPILQVLSRAEIVESKQGASGGYMIAHPDTTSLADVAALFIDAPKKENLCFTDWQPALMPVLEKAHNKALEELNKIYLSDITVLGKKYGGALEDEAPLDYII